MKQTLLKKCTKRPLACSSGMSWKPAIGFPDFWVSEYGDVVKASHNRRLKGHLDFDGYPSYQLTDKDGVKRHISAHRLVALSFIGEPPSENSQVAHMNGSRLFCHPSNIRWATPIENHSDRRDHGTGPFGERNPKAKLTEKDVLEIRSLHRDIKEGRLDMKVKDLADRYGIHHATLCGISKRKSWKHVK